MYAQEIGRREAIREEERETKGIGDRRCALVKVVVRCMSVT